MDYAEVRAHLQDKKGCPAVVVARVTEASVHVVVLSVEVLKGYRTRISILDHSELLQLKERSIKEWIKAITERWDKTIQGGGRKLTQAILITPEIPKQGQAELRKAVKVLSGLLDRYFETSGPSGKKGLSGTDPQVIQVETPKGSLLRKLRAQYADLVWDYLVSISGSSRKARKLKEKRKEYYGKLGQEPRGRGIRGAPEYIFECIIQFIATNAIHLDRTLGNSEAACQMPRCSTSAPYLFLQLYIRSTSAHSPVFEEIDVPVLCCIAHGKKSANEAFGSDTFGGFSLLPWAPEDAERTENLEESRDGSSDEHPELPNNT